MLSCFFHRPRVTSHGSLTTRAPIQLTAILITKAFFMKIHVACAIIEENGRVLAAQRNEFGRMPLKWEFPGGKIHVNESPEECLKREVMEEMGALLEIRRALPAGKP